MKIPTKSECFSLISEMKMLAHIVDHSMQVCRVATCLATHLCARYRHLNLELIRSAALLHDITKTRSFNTGEDHALTGGRFLAERGYPEVGELVRQHVVLDVYDSEKTPREADIVNYADKRVLHAEVVDLDTRLDYILERYATKADHRRRICLLWENTRSLEIKIFSNLPFSPGNIDRLLDAEVCSPDLSDQCEGSPEHHL